MTTPQPLTAVPLPGNGVPAKLALWGEFTGEARKRKLFFFLFFFREDIDAEFFGAQVVGFKNGEHKILILECVANLRIIVEDFCDLSADGDDVVFKLRVGNFHIFQKIVQHCCAVDCQ